jgi:hypothetical protein
LPQSEQGLDDAAAGACSAPKAAGAASMAAASTQIAGTATAAPGRLDEVDAMAVSLRSPDAKARGALASIVDARRLSMHGGRRICAWSIPGRLRRTRPPKPILSCEDDTHRAKAYLASNAKAAQGQGSTTGASRAGACHEPSSISPHRDRMPGDGEFRVSAAEAGHASGARGADSSGPGRRATRRLPRRPVLERGSGSCLQAPGVGVAFLLSAGEARAAARPRSRPGEHGDPPNYALACTGRSGTGPT